MSNHYEWLKRHLELGLSAGGGGDAAFCEGWDGVCPTAMQSNKVSRGGLF